MKPEIKQRIEQINNGEVPDGYKKTEFGFFPCDWVEKKLSDLFDFKNGVNADKDKYDSGIKMISVMDILSEHPIVYDSIIGQVDIDAKTLREYDVNYGDILFQRSSETFEDAGKSNIYLDSKVATYSGFVIRGKKKSDNNPYCIGEALKSNYARKQIIRGAAGSQHINIGQNSLEKISILLPLKFEQEKIAEILMKWDEAIELQERSIEKLNIRKKIVLQTIFNKKDNWTTCSLSQGTSILTSGGTPSTSNPNYFDGGIVWVSIDDISQSGKYINQSARTLSEDGIKNSSAKIFPKGTLLYAMYASIGKCAIADTECATSQAILGIVPKDDYFDKQYLYYYLCSIQDRVSLQGQKGTQSNLNKGMVADFKIPSPIKNNKNDIDEQKHIAKVLMTIDDVIVQNEAKLKIIKSQRKALQQYLLNGIVRII